MFCDNCKIKNATFVYKEIINGENIQYNLCGECAKKLNKNLMFLDMFKDFFLDFETINFQNNNLNIKCEKCGNTIENIKNTGKIGCENCYTTFKNDILSIIKNIQFDNKHIGKSLNKNIDNSKTEKHSLQKTLEDLRKKLKKAVEIEDYELAITLRDKIKEIEKEV